ncbi:hypothetical protein lerEdw1_006405 [Lerista edwardsae]|nr:hypothetical protein lerEdw1_006405 [Lerista edwardsae]
MAAHSAARRGQAAADAGVDRAVVVAMASLLCCGPKMAACGIVLSAWGVIMLVGAGPGGGWRRCTAGPGLPRGLRPGPALKAFSPPPRLQVLLGIFFNVHSAVLIEDVPTAEGDFADGTKKIYGLYEQVSYNCFIAAGLYVLLGGFSFCQVRLNKRKEYMVR